MASTFTFAGAGALTGVGAENLGVFAMAASGAVAAAGSGSVGLTVAGITADGSASWVSLTAAASSAVLAGQGSLAGAGAGPAPGVAALAGAGDLTATGSSTASSVATLAETGALFGVKFANGPVAASFSGKGGFGAAGSWAHHDPLVYELSWSLMINGSIIESVQYDPTTLNLKVSYANSLGQFIIVPGLPLGVSGAIQNAADPQAYVLNLIRS